MSLWDNVKKFAQPYSDDDYDDYDEDDDYADEYEEPAETPARRSPRRAPAPAPVAEEESDEQDDYGFTPAPAASNAVSAGFGGQVLNMNSSASNKQEVVLFHAKAFDDAAKAADELRNRRAVILNMENVDKALTRRVVDFLSGCAYALDGKIKKIAISTYIITPFNVDILGDLIDELENNCLYF